MNVYIAGRFARKLELQVYAARLRREGHTVTSRWLRGHNATESHEKLKLFAEEDLQDVHAADMVLLFTDGGDTDGGYSGGRHWECGYAFALGKKVWIVGPKENVFHHLEGVVAFERFEWAIQQIGSCLCQHKDYDHEHHRN